MLMSLHRAFLVPGRLLMALLYANVLIAGSVFGATLNWDPVSGNNQIDEGNGNWGTNPPPNWTADGGLTNQSFTNGDDVIFGGGAAGTAGTVTISGLGVTVGSFSLVAPNAGDFSFRGGDITVTDEFSIASGQTFTASGTFTLDLTNSLVNASQGNLRVDDGEILTIITNGAGVADPGALIHTSFDDNTNVGLDSQGNYNGTTGGNAKFSSSSIIGSGAIEFDGDDDYLSFGDVNEMDQAGDFSLSMWFKRESDVGDDTNHNTDNVLIAQSSGGNNDNLELGTSGNNLEHYMDTTGSDTERTLAVPGGINTDWNHVVLTYDVSASQVQYFYNGVLIGTDSATWSGNLDDSSGSPLTLGLARPGDNDWGDFDGFIDEFYLFESVIDQDAIDALSDASRVDPFGLNLGNLTVEDGSTLRLNSDGSGRSEFVTITSNGNATIEGQAIVNDTLTLNTGSTLTLENSTALTQLGDAVMNDNTQLNLNSDGSGTGNFNSITTSGDTAITGTVASSGDVNVQAGSTLTLVDDFTVSDNATIQVADTGTMVFDDTMTLDFGDSTLDMSDGAMRVTSGNNLTLDLSGTGAPAFTADSVYYNFDTDNAITVDDSGNGFNASVIGGTPTINTSIFVEGDGSGRFDGNDGLRPANGDNIFNDAESLLSVAFWFNLDDVSGSTLNQLFEEGGSTNGVQIYGQGDDLVVEIHNGSGSDYASVTASNALTASEWAHVALVYNNSDISLYLDGMLIGTDTFAATLAAHSSEPGLGNVDGAPFENGTLTGYIDEFYYFDDYVLDADDIAFLSNNRTSSELSHLTLESGSTITLNGDNAQAHFSSITATGDATITGNARLTGTTVDVSPGSTLTTDIALTGSEAFIKNGDGTMILEATEAGTHNGTTTVNAGILALDSPNGTNAIGNSDITLNGGSLRLDSDNVIHNGADLTLAGGTFNLNGHEETMDNLTLNGNSIIDFGAGTVDLTFDDLALTSGQLSIYNWSGAFSQLGTAGTAGSDDRLLFTNITGFSEGDYLGNVVFYSGSGTGKLGFQGRLVAAAEGGGVLELVPVPEASTCLMLGLLGFTALWLRVRAVRAR